MIITNLKKLKRKIEKKLNIYKLIISKNTILSLVKKAIDETMVEQLDAQEKLYIQKIEKMRQNLENSSEQITRIDYGARTSTSNNTQDEMEKGTLVTSIIGDICKVASKPPIWCLVLFKLIRYFQPKTCLEMGTALGISGAYQASALKINNGGKLITMEGDESLAKIAGDNFLNLALDNVSIKVGRFQDTLTDVLLNNNPVDYVFVDGHHDEQATINYFNTILPYLSDRSIIIFDDILWSEGMKRAWNKIKSDEIINYSISLGLLGLCIVDKKSNVKNKHFEIPLM